MSNDKPTLSVYEKAQSLLQVAARTAKNRLFLTNSEDVKKRRAICEGCPTGRRRGRRCNKCSCNIYVKTLVRNAECPDGHWGPGDDKPES
jgi:hypothetical protein